MSVLVFGSINMDLVACVPHLPLPGETLTGKEFSTIPGGKGANQAVAAARLGVPTHLVGRVGGDSFGQDLIAGLKESGVKCDRIQIDSSTSSGIALIEVEDSGENRIVIIAGANGEVKPQDVEQLLDLLPTAQVLLLQLEIPLAAVCAAAKAAHQSGVLVMLDPAPAPSSLPSDLYPLIDILTPNQVEAGQLVGFPVEDQATAEKAAGVLRSRGVKTVIIKLGAQGCLCATAEGNRWIPAFSVSVVDTTAAGDAFNGGVAAALAEGLSLQQALTWGTATGALSVTQSGAQPSLPNREELMRFLQNHQHQRPI